MTSLRLSIVLVALALISCKDKASTQSDKAADKPADKASETPVDKVADKPAAEPAPEPAAATPADPAGKPAADGWTTYTSKEAKYSIEFPTAPKEKSQGIASLVVAEFGVTEADPRTATCGMATAPVPNKDAAPATMLDAMVAGYKTDATVLEEKTITIGANKYPGRHLVIQNARHRKWFRLYVIEDKLYINTCGGPFDRGDKDAPTAMRVLESFKPTI